MQSDDQDNLPVVDASRTTLGVKLHDGPDIPMDRDALVYPGTGGMSVAPAPEDLPIGYRPRSLGGRSRRPVWEFDLGNLPSDLAFRPTSATHGVIEPGRVLHVDEYQRALHSLRAFWRIAVPK